VNEMKNISITRSINYSRSHQQRGDTMYEIIRFYESRHAPRVVRRGLTKEQAVHHCCDPDTASISASEEVRREEMLEGSWFDFYRKVIED